MLPYLQPNTVLLLLPGAGGMGGFTKGRQGNCPVLGLSLLCKMGSQSLRAGCRKVFSAAAFIFRLALIVRNTLYILIKYPLQYV